jgi:hypothetical protein
MNNEKKVSKVSLDDIEVKSFLTSLHRDEQETIKGGSESVPGARTSHPIFC